MNEGDLTDPHVIRQIKFLKQLGTAALDETDLRQVYLQSLLKKYYIIILLLQ